jgi:Flp pilus assembly pilin Flp
VSGRSGEKGSDVSVIKSHLRLLGRREGQTLAEYAVILGVITLAVVGVFTGLAGGISQAMNGVVSAF